jgi:hypothetical protein
VQGPDLHVRAVARISDIARVVEQDAGGVVARQLLADAAQPRRPRPDEGRVRDRAHQRPVSAVWVQVSGLVRVLDDGEREGCGGVGRHARADAVSFPWIPLISARLVIQPTGPEPSATTMGLSVSEAMSRRASSVASGATCGAEARLRAPSSGSMMRLAVTRPRRETPAMRPLEISLTGEVSSGRFFALPNDYFEFIVKQAPPKAHWCSSSKQFLFAKGKHAVRHAREI